MVEAWDEYGVCWISHQIEDHSILDGGQLIFRVGFESTGNSAMDIRAVVVSESPEVVQEEWGKHL